MKIKLGLGPLCMKDVAAYCGGDYYNFTGDDSVFFEWICTDSSEADADTMMVAIRGERADGHDYIGKAMENGCRCFLCEYVPSCIAGRSVSAVIAEDSVSVLCRIAQNYREKQPLLRIAVTGSVGKTTAKEMIGAALGESMQVFRTAGNFNSTIGMPLSYMSVGADSEAAVFEMGMSGFGEIAAMTQAAQPQIAVITNIGTSHLEFLKTRENIARAKLEIASGLQKGGVLLLNGDEPLLAGHHGDGYRTLYVSCEGNPTADYAVREIVCAAGESRFTLSCPQGEQVCVTIPALGKHMVAEAAFAYAVAAEAGVERDAILRGLLRYQPLGRRQNVRPCGDVTLIEDCYNAAPESMHAALDVLSIRKREKGGRSICVLGDMLELGEQSDAFHREVGTYAANSGADLLFTLGTRALAYADGARAAHMKASQICSFSDADEETVTAMAKAVADALLPGDTVLIKGSRAMRMERICAYLDSRFSQTEDGASPKTQN